MSLQILDPTKYEGWDETLLSHPDYSFFHSSSWAKVLCESYGYTPRYFTLLDGNKIMALIPIMEINSFLTGKRGISLPFTDYCELIIHDGLPFQDLFTQLIDYGRNCGWKFVELRGGKNHLSCTQVSTSYLGHILNLSQGEERLFSGFRDSTKRNIKKALKEGVRITISNTLECVQEFCRLNGLTRRDHGLPPQPYDFFKKIYEHVIAKNLGFIVLASYNNSNIAGAVYFSFGDRTSYKYGASDKKFQQLRANNLVMWEGIRECIRRECTLLSLGRTDLGHEGLLQFKRGWGATEQQICYYRYDLKKGSFVSCSSKVTGFYKKIFRSLPIPILNKIGALLYKHAG